MGRYDASYGWCLLGGPASGLTALMPDASGFKVPGDARRILSLEINGKKHVVAAVNNGELQILEFLK
jgi:hypothetical protein